MSGRTIVKSILRWLGLVALLVFFLTDLWKIVWWIIGFVGIYGGLVVYLFPTLPRIIVSLAIAVYSFFRKIFSYPLSWIRAIGRAFYISVWWLSHNLGKILGILIGGYAVFLIIYNNIPSVREAQASAARVDSVVAANQQQRAIREQQKALEDEALLTIVDATKEEDMARVTYAERMVWKLRMNTPNALESTIKDFKLSYAREFKKMSKQDREKALQRALSSH